MKRITALLVLLLLVSFGAVAQSSVGDVWFAESNLTVAAGQGFNTNVKVNTGTTMKLAAYTFEYTFSSTVLAVNTAVGTSGVTAGTDGFVTVVNPNTAGKLTISSFDIYGKGPSTSLSLISIAWTAKANGTTTITNNVKSLSSETAVTIGTPRGLSLQVTVGTVTPTPTRAVTPTPTRVVTATPTRAVTATPTRGATPTPTRVVTATPTRVVTATPTRAVTATPTRVVTPTPVRTSCPCSNPTSVTAPYTKDGTGDVCLSMASIPNYINSWNLTTLEINCTNLTNKYVAAASLPAKINNLYYIHYVSSSASGHFEAK